MAHHEPAVLSSYLQTFGYDAHDFAGCVRVRLSLAYAVTIECEPDCVRFVSQAGTALWVNFLAFLLTAGGFYCVLLYAETTGWMAAYVTAFIAASELPYLVYLIVRWVQTENAVNTLRILVALKGAAESSRTVGAIGAR